MAKKNDDFFVEKKHGLLLRTNFWGVISSHMSLKYYIHLNL